MTRPPGISTCSRGHGGQHVRGSEPAGTHAPRTSQPDTDVAVEPPEHLHRANAGDGL